MRRGRLISFEGLDGAGKTTQMRLLEQWFQTQNIPCISTREPGGTPLGTEIRHLLLQRPELAITPLAEALLFQADRAQHFSTLVLPALAIGTHVITDRCFDSSIAYQGVARNMGAELIEQLSLIATQGHVPDLTILLDLDPALVPVRTRKIDDHSSMREEQTHFDREHEEFHVRLRQAFLLLAQKHSERIKVINATQSLQQLHQKIVALVAPLLDV